MLPRVLRSNALVLRGAVILCGWATVAKAHDAISFDPNAPSPYSINGTWGQSAPTTLHGLATAVLRTNGLEIDLTLADGAAYKLLDPAQETAGTANATTDVNNDQFAKDEPLLINRARTFFNVTDNGAALNIGSVSAELNASRNIVFRLLFPPVAPGTLRLEMTYLGQNPPGEKDLLTVLDRTGVTLASASLDADNPSLEVSVPGPEASRVYLKKWLILIPGVLMVVVVLVLLSKLRKSQPES